MFLDVEERHACKSHSSIASRFRAAAEPYGSPFMSHFYSFLS